MKGKYDLQKFDTQLTEFFSKVKEARLKAGLTHRQVEKETGITYGYLSRLENGVRDNPSITVVYILCDYFDIPLETVLTLKKEQVGNVTE